MHAVCIRTTHTLMENESHRFSQRLPRKQSILTEAGRLRATPRWLERPKWGRLHYCRNKLTKTRPNYATEWERLRSYSSNTPHNLLPSLVGT